MKAYPIKRTQFEFSRHRPNRLAILLALLLALSLSGNAAQYFSHLMDSWDTLYTENANSRDTYFTIHNVRQAQTLSKGKGIKVGVIDAYFALNAYPDLYAGGQDFAGEPDALYTDRSHGWQMASVLREIAPECEIYALNLSHENEEKMVDSIISAIDWAKRNGISVLTLSQGEISAQNRPRLDEAVNAAVADGITTCFIHYDNPNNLLPYSTTPYLGDYGRDPDINVFHYDYSGIRPTQIRRYMERETPPESGDDVPYFSFSSMSPVTAGFAAILKSIDPLLTPAECKQLLIDTSYQLDYTGVMEWETGISEHTVDLYQAALAAQRRA